MVKTMRKCKWFIALMLLLMVQGVSAQQPAFWQDIQKFKQADSVAFPAKGQILFVGSSSFRLWKDVQQCFPAHSIINRGFGGSTLTDLIRYAPDIILPYAPKQIVIYCGENDLAADAKLTAQQAAERFFTLFEIIRAKYKKVPIAYVAMKPSPSRAHLMAKYNVANAMIKMFLKKKRRTAFIDVYHAMLDENGKPMTDIFLSDQLHMNKKGYDIWQRIILPYLKLESFARCH